MGSGCWEPSLQTDLPEEPHVSGERWYQTSGNCLWAPAPSPLCWGFGFVPLNWLLERNKRKVRATSFTAASRHIYGGTYPVQGSWISRDGANRGTSHGYHQPGNESACSGQRATCLVQGRRVVKTSDGIWRENTLRLRITLPESCLDIRSTGG